VRSPAPRSRSHPSCRIAARASPRSSVGHAIGPSIETIHGSALPLPACGRSHRPPGRLRDARWRPLASRCQALRATACTGGPSWCRVIPTLIVPSHRCSQSAAGFSVENRENSGDSRVEIPEARIFSPVRRVSEHRDAASGPAAGERAVEAGLLLRRQRELAGGGVLERVLDARGLRDREHAGAADEEGERHLAGSGAVRPGSGPSRRGYYDAPERETRGREARPGRAGPESENAGYVNFPGFPANEGYGAASLSAM